MHRLQWVLFLIAATVPAQNAEQSTNSPFDSSEVKTFTVRNIMVEGEVENPGLIDLDRLPQRSIAVKELAADNGGSAFKGAYLFSGYALSDILDSKKFRKAEGNSFSPPLDLYVIIENVAGEKAVVSWGELYYTRDGGNVLISKSVRAINPARTKTRWPLPGTSQLVCGNDRLNARFLIDPTKITVRSYRGPFAARKPESIYSSEIKIVRANVSASVVEIGPGVETRKYATVAYGHGSGFKEVQNVTGFVMKDLLVAKVKANEVDLAQTIVVVSSKDGYRSVFGASEILDRNDNQELLLVDRKDAQEGRYSLFAGDFFLDRNVKAVEKIEVVHIR